MLADPARAQFLPVLAGVVAVLLVASTVSYLLQQRAGASRTAELTNLETRIRAWWVMVALLAATVLAGGAAVTALFAALSMLAVREVLAHAPREAHDPMLDGGCYALVALQYAFVATGDVRLVAIGVPLATAAALPLAALGSGGTRALRARVALRLRAVLLAGWGLSFVPALLLLDAPGLPARSLLLVVWIVIVAQGSDVLQYVCGKLFGRRAIAPRLSPDKTVEGFVGGTLAAAAIGTALAWMTPFSTPVAALAALAVTLQGFIGGLVLSAWKRRLGIKDWGRWIRGHGGVLDRVDSLCLSAPTLFGIALGLSVT